MNKDTKGRKRSVEDRFKPGVLIALGSWPDPGRQEAVAWELSDGEGSRAWLNCLSQVWRLHHVVRWGRRSVCARTGPAGPLGARYADPLGQRRSA